MKVGTTAKAIAEWVIAGGKGVTINGVEAAAPPRLTTAPHPETGEPVDWVEWYTAGEGGSYHRMLIRGDARVELEVPEGVDAPVPS